MNGYPGAPRIADRFRGFLPVVVDVETGGFNSSTDALLEIAAVLIEITALAAMLRKAHSERRFVMEQTPPGEVSGPRANARPRL